MSDAVQRGAGAEAGNPPHQTEIDALVARARDAAAAFLRLGQADVDRIVAAMARAGEAERLALARLAVERWFTHTAFLLCVSVRIALSVGLASWRR